MLYSLVARERNNLIGYSINTLYDEILWAYIIYIYTYIPLETINTLALCTWVFI